MKRAVLLLASLLLPARARAGNDEGVLVGGQAALTGGAITAITGDGAAAWYNPAGLARITRHSFDINASAYGVSLTTATNLFTLPDGQTSNASFIDWQLIPSALSYSRVLSERVVGSLGVFIPSTTDADLRASILQSDGTRWTVGADETRNEYTYIASAAIRLREDLRVGVALHGVYTSDETMLQLAAGKPGAAGQQPFFSSSQHETRGDYGVRVGMGVQWLPTSRLAFGLSMQTPMLTGFRKIASDLVLSNYLGDELGGVYESVHIKELRKPWDFSTPLYVRLGAAYTVGRAQLLLDGNLSSPLNTQEESQDRKVNGNVRVGALVTHSDRLTYGGGLFTDRSSFRDTDSKFIGLSGGVRIAENYTITEGQRQLTFATTLAGRYAYGWGSTAGTVFVSDTQPERSVRADVRAHELAFNLSGAVTF